MRDPGYLPEHAWRDSDHENYDRMVDEVLEADEDRNVLEPRSAWLHRALATRLLPAVQGRAVQYPDAAARSADPSLDAPATFPVGAFKPF